MGSGYLNIHFHHHGGSKREISSVPKGCVTITAGQGEKQQKFFIPVIYVNHPMFRELLKEAEEEYGFNQKGPINIPVHVDEFCQIRGLIDRETSSDHHRHQFLCFKA